MLNSGNSLLAREINWLETGGIDTVYSATINNSFLSPYSLGKLIDWKL
jgi:hypothetical protein